MERPPLEIQYNLFSASAHRGRSHCRREHTFAEGPSQAVIALYGVVMTRRGLAERALWVI